MLSKVVGKLIAGTRLNILLKFANKIREKSIFAPLIVTEQSKLLLIAKIEADIPATFTERKNSNNVSNSIELRFVNCHSKPHSPSVNSFLYFLRTLLEASNKIISRIIYATIKHHCRLFRKTKQH